MASLEAEASGTATTTMTTTALPATRSTFPSRARSLNSTSRPTVPKGSCRLGKWKKKYLQGDPSPRGPGLGWLGFGMFHCLAWAAPQLQYSPAACGTSQIQVNPTQVREEMGHPVFVYLLLLLNLFWDSVFFRWSFSCVFTVFPGTINTVINRTLFTH